MGIKLETAKEIAPDALRKRFGDKIGNEVWHLTRIVIQEDKTVQYLLKTLDDLNEERREALINAVWCQYYIKVSQNLLYEQ